MFTCKNILVTALPPQPSVNYTGSFVISLPTNVQLRKLLLDTNLGLHVVADMLEDANVYRRDVTVSVFASNMNQNSLPNTCKYLDSVLVGGVFLHAYWNTLNPVARAAPSTSSKTTAKKTKST